MPETSGINAGNGIKKIGSEQQKSSGYEYIHSPSKQKITKLRVGELVKGTIIKIPQKNVAIVRLPIGTLTAEINGQLKPGDSLLLKVEKIKPNLVFKIHSVSAVIEGKEISINEILRILDLPQSKDFFEIVQIIKHYKSNIIRQEVIQIQNFLKQTDNNFIKQFNLSLIIQTLLFFNKINLPYTENLLLRFIPLFIKSQQLDKQFENILNYETDNPKIMNIIHSIKNLFSQNKLKENLLNINLLKLKNDTLYELLIQLKNIILIDNIAQYLLNDLNYFIYYLEGQFLNNLLANKLNINSYILIPLLFRKKLKLMKVSYKLSKTNKKKNLKFTFLINDEDISIIESQGILNDNFLEINIEAFDKNIAELIQKSITELQKLLADNNFIVSSIKISSLDDKTVETLKSADDKSSNFSVVI